MSTKKEEVPKPIAKEEKDALVTLEDDDEFEDFPVEGMLFDTTESSGGTNTKVDWSDEQTVGEQTQQHLWEQDWDDDDDAEDEFSKQLK